MHISKTTKKLARILFVGFLAANLALENFSLGLFEDALELWHDRKVVDNLYLATHNKNVIDNFVPTASANPGTRVRTVEFFAGQDAGSATNDNQNQQQNFTSQTFQMAESSVNITDAYVEVSAQIGATTATTYASGHVFFDACVPTCTPSPAAFTTTAGLGTNSNESQSIRFRASVISETEIAAYTGGAANRTFQVGYCFGTGATCSGTTAANIQGANAKLVLTYTYDDTSATQTNTVIYPLESASETGSKTASQASCTIDSNCPTFSYNANIPEISSQLSQFFYLQTSINAATTTDWQSASDIGGNPGGANTSAVFFEEALSTNGGWVNWIRSGVAGYANNSAQSLEISTNGPAYVLGGENYVTYTYSNGAATKTRTVVMPVGEVCTTGCTTKSALTGPTVYFPESGVSVKKAWFRVHTSDGGIGTAGTLAITSKVGNNSETTQTSYSFATDTAGVTDDGYYIHLIPSADYTELGSATGASGKAVQMTAQWTATAGGAVSAELVITYQYTGESSGYLVAQNLFAGQQTAAPATSYSTATGAIDPSLPETTGTKTIRGASIRMSAKDTSSTANDTVGANLSTSTCTASNTSTPVTDTEITRVMLWKNVSSVVTNSDAQTYTACYSGGQAAVFTGILVITYQWDAPQPATAQSVYRWRNDNGSETTATWKDVANAPITNVNVGSDAELIRLRFAIKETNNASLALDSRVEFSSDATSCTTGAWTAMDTTSTAWRLVDSANFTNDAATTQQVSSPDTFTAGSMLDTANPDSTAITIQNNTTEVEFAFKGLSASFSTTYRFRITDNGTTLGSYTNCGQATTEATATFAQNNYAWYVNPSPTIENVTDLWPSGSINLGENTALTPVPVSNDPPTNTQELRLRVSVTVNGAIIGGNQRWFKLQFRTGTDSDCSTGSWTDVGAAGGGDAFVYTSDTTVADDTTLTVAKLTGTDRLETYSRVKPANTPTGTSVTGEDIEFDFHIVGGTAFASATRYLLRVVETTSDGTGTTALTSYSANCPILHTEPGVGNEMRHGKFFSGGTEQGFFWVD